MPDKCKLTDSARGPCPRLALSLHPYFVHMWCVCVCVCVCLAVQVVGACACACVCVSVCVFVPCVCLFVCVSSRELACTIVYSFQLTQSGNAASLTLSRCLSVFEASCLPLRSSWVFPLLLPRHCMSHNTTVVKTTTSDTANLQRCCRPRPSTAGAGR